MALPLNTLGIPAKKPKLLPRQQGRPGLTVAGQFRLLHIAMPFNGL